MNERWKALIAQSFIPFIPLVRALVRYGPLNLRTTIWNHIGHTRLVGLPHRFAVRTEYGRFTGDSSDMLSKYVYYLGQWEPEVTHLIRQRLRPGHTLVDVGANTGWFTLLAADTVGPTGRVVAIEASPTNFLRLKENVSSNRLENVRLVNEAVWSSEALLPLFQGPPSHSGVSTVMPSFAERQRCKLAGQISACPLPELLSPDEIATLRILKIDVEGAEREVLLGLEPVLDSVPDDLEIFLELNPTEYDVDDLLRRMRKRGFRVWIMPNQYTSKYCINYSALHRRESFEELLETPKQQVNVLVSRIRP
ncbi:MAG: FkbM family methyltransferase [Terriglobales bacterium]